MLPQQPKPSDQWHQLPEAQMPQQPQAADQRTEPESQGPEVLLKQVLVKVSFVEGRMDSAECKTSDLMRHVSQHLAEFSMEAAHGDLSILSVWILTLKGQFLRAGYGLGLKDGELSEAYQMIMGSVEMQLRVESKNEELKAATRVLSLPADAEAAEVKAETDAFILAFQLV